MGEHLFGQVDFLVGLAGVEEGDGEGAQGLIVGGLEGAFGEPQRRRFMGEPCDLGGQGYGEGVQQGHRAQHMPLIGGQVADRAGDQGGEVTEVVLLRYPSGAPYLQKPSDRQVEI